MFKLIKHRSTNNFLNILISKERKLLNQTRAYVLFLSHPLEVKSRVDTQKNLILNMVQYDVITSRQKSRSRRKNARNYEEEDDSDDEDEDDEDEAFDDSSVKTYNLSSLRVDLILKQVLNQKRKKIEEYFYHNKIRVNGKVLFKKASNICVGDELDLIKGIVKDKSGFIEVSRVEILGLKPNDEDSERVLVKVKKHKSLVIENYPEGDVWKEPEPEV